MSPFLTPKPLLYKGLNECSGKNVERVHPIVLLRSGPCYSVVVRWGEPSLVLLVTPVPGSLSQSHLLVVTGSLISRMQMSQVKDYSGTMKVWMSAHESTKCNIEAN